MSKGEERHHTRFIRVGLPPPLRYLDFDRLLDEINVDRPRQLERNQVDVAFEIIRETRTDSGAQCIAIEAMIREEATPSWRHAARSAGTPRVAGGLLVTVLSGIDAVASGGLISMTIGHGRRRDFYLGAVADPARRPTDPVGGAGPRTL